MWNSIGLLLTVGIITDLFWEMSAKSSITGLPDTYPEIVKILFSPKAISKGLHPILASVNQWFHLRPIQIQGAFDDLADADLRLERTPTYARVEP